MAMIPDQDKEFLRNKFNDELQSPVTLIVLTKLGHDLEMQGVKCEYCAETEELVSEVAELSDKIKVESREYSQDDQMVSGMKIDKIPAIVVMSGADTGVRYYGIPGGFEFSSLIEDIVDVSRNSTDLSQDAKEKARGIVQDVHIQVFVTPTCPYCPSVVRMAHQMAIENPQHVTADAIEAAEFPDLVNKYGIEAVPTVVINDKVQFEGALPEAEFADRVMHAIAA